MVDIMTLNGGRSMLDAPEIAALRSGLRGAVLLSGDEGYETARRVWNGNVDRRPAVIVRCMSASDVQRAVDFARKRDLLVSVRGGGHSAPGYGTNDGGLVIDLSSMKAISVDPAGARRGPRAACCGAIWTARRRPMALRPQAARCRTPASAD